MPSSAMPPPKDSSCILDYWIPPHTHLHTSYPTPDTGIPCHQGSSTGPFYPNSVNSLCLPYPMNSCHFTIMLPHPEISISIPIGQLRLHCVCGGGGDLCHISTAGLASTSLPSQSPKLLELSQQPRGVTPFAKKLWLSISSLSLMRSGNTWEMPLGMSTSDSLDSCKKAGHCGQHHSLDNRP